MSDTGTLNREQQEAVSVYGRSSSDSGRCRIRKDQGPDLQNCSSD